MWEKKCASRRVEGLSKRKFIKKGKDSSSTSALKQERSLESASKGPKSIKLRKIRREKCPQKFISPTKKEKKKEKEKKAQKGGLGKS